MSVFPFLILFLTIECTLGDPLVRTNLGPVQGIVLKAENGRNFNAFLGIPYAKPPVGKLRFSPPVEADPWPGIHKATKDGPICPQRDIFANSSEIIGSEDCLYMNIYTPKLPSEEESYPLPVMVWIHGGSWLWWSGSSRHFAPNRLMNKDMILVSINYRLGWLGFLSTEDEVVRGNNGLKDQSMAIKWVKEHISAFGGDPERITVAGQDAGGISAHLHTFSPLSKDIISGVIVQSGTAFNPMALYYPGEGLTKAKILASSHTCTTKSNAEMIECLRNVDANRIASSDNALFIWNGQPSMPFRAVVEVSTRDAFLVEHPEYSVDSGNHEKIPMMVGNVLDDGAIYTSSWVYSPYILSTMDKNYLTAFPALFFYEEHFSDETKNEVSGAVKTRYIGNKPISILSIPALQEALSTRIFRHPVHWLAQRQHRNNTIYLYQLNYRGSRSFSQVFGAGSLINLGVCHYDDLLYLFDFASLFGKVSSTYEDGIMIETMSELWYNFAATGNPTPEVTELLPMKWKAVTSNVSETLYINGPQSFLMKPIEATYLTEDKFWDDLPIAHNPDYHLYPRTDKPTWKTKLRKVYKNIKKGLGRIFG